MPSKALELEPDSPEQALSKALSDDQAADLERRARGATDRWHRLLDQVVAVLDSHDESDLGALEACVSGLRQREQEALTRHFRDMAFLSDEPLTRQARLHARFQNRIAEEFRLYSASELGERLGAKPASARQKVNRWVQERKLFTVPDTVEKIPEFQIDWERRQPHPLVAETLEHFPGEARGWAVAYWMCQENALLDGRRPVDVMDSDPDAYRLALKEIGAAIEN